MAEVSSAIPTPESDDPDDVAVALETAKALWGIGDKQEAVRWLRRGAEAAEQAGNDPRAVRLARTAAELVGELQKESGLLSMTPPPPPAAPSATPPPLPTAVAPSPVPPPPPSRRPPPLPQPPPPPSSPSQLPPLPPPQRPPPSAPSHPAPAPPAEAAQAPPSLAAAKAKRRVSASPSLPPPAAAAKTPAKTRPRPPPVHEVDEPTIPVMKHHLEATRKLEAESAPKFDSEITRKHVRDPARKSKASAPHASEQGPDVWHALRVSVKRSARDPDLFVLRRLDNGSSAPPGTREALIVLVDSGSELFDRDD